MIVPTPRGVLCSGNIVYDTLVSVAEEPRWGAASFADRLEYHVGGNGANTSIALATLGATVRLLGAIGRDPQGKFVLETLRRAGVDTGAITTSDAPTAASVVIVNPAGDRKLLHRPGASVAAFRHALEFTPAITGGMSHYHQGSIFTMPGLRDHAAPTLARARAAGLATSLDTNWDPDGRWMTDLAPCFEHLDFIFMNQDEARMTTGKTTASQAAAELLRRGVRTAVLKLGAQGCAIYTSSRELVCPAFKVEAKDTTGAGDCFVGAFLAALLEAAPLSEAGQFANAVAALAIQRLGGAAGAPSRPEVDAFMRSATLRT
jgi:sugar/nucleoside kinase (ribokinase family)